MPRWLQPAVISCAGDDHDDGGDDHDDGGDDLAYDDHDDDGEMIIMMMVVIILPAIPAFPDF